MVRGSAVVSKPARACRASLLIGLVLTATAGCGEPVGVPVVDIRVTVTTTGIDLDPDGYRVAVSRRSPVPIGTNDTVTLGATDARTSTVTLDGLALNCVVAGPNPRAVQVRFGFKPAVAFDVTCVTATALVFEVPSEGDIYSIKSNGTGLARLTSIPAWDGDPAWSPDRSRIVFSSERDGDREIYTMSAQGSDVVRLTTSLNADHSPAWSPDGGRIAFVSGRHGNPEIHVMNADGSNVVRLTDDVGNDVDPAWSPDGSRIAFASDRSFGTLNLYLMNADGSGLRHVWGGSSSALLHPAWSPDGRWVAFTEHRCFGEIGCLDEVWLVEADGTALFPAWERGGAYPSWSSDGVMLAITGPACVYGHDYYYYEPFLQCEPRGLRIVRVAPNTEIIELTGSDAADASWQR